ncbi:MAG: ribose 5-phosphate isomerase A [Alphaproteobacteria bacterium]|jgi:ribose 5-phosphate isomerase A|nr:ribose 5-phosphate isomerase A [Alphaproteobacteria bacterium]MCB1551045.1 ribose 5-phosphate isomerase A [Alphaproteobacteria bacterium]MCB9984596.1 ribose 5-phosphate isomerase A [Micavibrio sp.]HPQ51506.1 ribose 5-phosphate isomerase A [Alphaproteobacteria bacterium]HRK97939.1 ribose 5-phosphate isomerase A [Alphaproteobacteria bacterium]
MLWTNPLSKKLPDYGQIANLEEKTSVARKLAGEVKDGQVIGVGSGSTSFLALQEIARAANEKNYRCRFIPSSREIHMTCLALGLSVASLLDARPDWYFDGADEVDKDGNLIKGRGGAMTREKMVMVASPKTFILVDKSKFVDKLGMNFPVPVEVNQESANYVEEELLKLGATDTKVRPAKGKDGAIVTESGHFILDARFADIGASLEKDIKSITGVIESGLFWGYNPEIVSS